MSDNFFDRYLESWGEQSSQPSPVTCKYADLLTGWAEPVVSNIERSPHLVKILETKLYLLDKYMGIRSLAPKAHRDKVGSSGHICLFQRFEEFYNRLRIVELSVTPPLLVAQPPAAPTEPEKTVYIIGEVEQ